MAAITSISPDDARTLSISLFRAMEILAHADAHLHSVHSEKGEGDTEITTILFRASQVAHSSCESALARVEIFYDTDTECTVVADDSASCSCLCMSLVSSALKNADTVSTALEYTSKNYLITTLSSSVLCGNEATRAAIDAGDLGAISLTVVLLLELPSLPSLLSPPHQVLHYACKSKSKSKSNASTEPDVNTRIVCVLLTVHEIAASACNADPHGDTALMIAATFGYTATVIALLACPAVVQSAGAVNKYGNTALTIAATFGYTATVIALLACPAVVQSAGAVNRYGNTALMIASRNGNTETVTALLACPPVVQSAGAVNTYGDTALTLACNGGHTETVIALIACPAVVQSASIENTYGDTALMLAQKNKNDAVIALLSSFNIVV
jgi:ankyrin repeat protein